MKHTLVTGGAGFIGSNFVHHVMNQAGAHERVTVLDALTYAGDYDNLKAWTKDQRFNFIHGDIKEEGLVADIISDLDITHIVHFAAESHVDRSILGPAEFIKTNVFGTFQILEAIRLSGWKDRAKNLLLHISTDEVYGSLGNEGKFTESTPYDPHSPYSASKAASDHLVMAYYHTFGVPAVISNCSNNFGPFQFPEKLIPVIIIKALQRKPIPVYGSGQNVRDWLFVEDHCAALMRILDAGSPGESYNIGGENEWKNIDIVRHICGILDTIRPEGAPHENLITFVDDRPGHDFRYAIDAGKARRELSWTPAFSFDSAMKKTVRWYMDNEEWWKKHLNH